MATSLVLTVIGEDRPGLVESLSRTIAQHDGSWLESRMARLAGKFAGILRASVPEERAEALAEALRTLESGDLHLIVEAAGDETEPDPGSRLQLELVGSDRPGIIREISQALASRGVNVDELETETRSAPMTGEPLFHARALLGLPPGLALDELQQSLEDIAHDLMVDLQLQEAKPEGRAKG